MKRWKLGLLLISGLLLVVPTLGSPTAAAATSNSGAPFNIFTSPLPIDLTGPPGSTLSTDIRVKNGGDTNETFKVTLMKFSAYGDQGKPAIHDRGPGDDYFDWVSFSPQTFAAPPNVWQTVKMTINLPSTAAFGYYYAVIFSRAGDTPTHTNKENVLVGSSAVLVLVDAQVPGAKRAAQVVSFTSDKHVYEFLPATFQVKLHNSGNVHLIAHGDIFISKGGKTVAKLAVNSARGNVLPGSNRVFAASWDDGFPVYVTKERGGQVLLDSQDKPVKGLRWDFSKFSKLKFGHYTAHLLMAYDNGQADVPLNAELSFWVIPWRVIFLAIAIPVTPAVAVYLLMRWRFKKRLAKAVHGSKSKKDT